MELNNSWTDQWREIQTFSTFKNRTEHEEMTEIGSPWVFMYVENEEGSKKENEGGEDEASRS